MKNSGKTLGYLTGGSFDFLIPPLPEERSYKDEVFKEYPSMVVPPDGGDVTLQEIRSPPDVFHFFFVGYILYEDMFGDEHTNRFAYEINLQAGTSQPAGGKDWHEWD